MKARSWLPSWWWKPLAGLAVAAALLGGAEGALRAWLGPPPPPVRVMRALAEHDQYFEVQPDGRIRPAYQHHDPIPPFPATSEEPRVAVLGGSSVHFGTQGIGLAGEFPALLQERIGVPVLNLGHPGLDSFDLVEMTEELTALDIDAIVVYAGHNDFGNTKFEARYGTVQAGMTAYVQSWLSHLQLYSQLSRALRPPTGTDRRHHVEDPQAMEGEQAPISPAQRDTALRNLAANFRRIAWLTDKAGIALVLVTPVSQLTSPGGRNARCPDESQPCSARLFAEARRIRLEDPEQSVMLLRQARDVDPASIRAPTAAQQAVLQIASEWPHVVGVNAEEELPRDMGFDVPARWLFIDPIHLSARGHVAMAELLAPAVVAAFERRGGPP